MQSVWFGITFSRCIRFDWEISRGHGNSSKLNIIWAGLLYPVVEKLLHSPMKSPKNRFLNAIIFKSPNRNQNFHSLNRSDQIISFQRNFSSFLTKYLIPEFTESLLLLPPLILSLWSLFYFFTDFSTLYYLLPIPSCVPPAIINMFFHLRACNSTPPISSSFHI